MVAWIWALVASGLALTSGAAEPGRRPNVVLVLADDLAWSALPAYGDTVNVTPNLDRLATVSDRFTRAYAASPVCMPSRMALWTGQYPVRYRSYDVRWAYDGWNWKTLYPFSNTTIPEGTVTLAEALKELGYATGYFGKWDSPLSGESPPTRHGWDVFHERPTAHTRMDPAWAWLGKAYGANYKSLFDAELKEGEYPRDELIEQAGAFIDGHADEPFFLVLSSTYPHIPVATAAGWLHDQMAERITAKGDGKARHPSYAALINLLDWQVGQVLAYLDKGGATERTIIIVTSDNGADEIPHLVPMTDNAPLNGAKGGLLEGGIRVPLLIRWPGMTDEPAVRTAVVSLMDLYPTIVEMAGSKEGPADRDGVSIASYLTDDQPPAARRLYWYSPARWSHSSAAATIADDAKYIHSFELQEDYLFDLREDLGETNNLAPARPEVVMGERERLWEWFDRWQVRLPQWNPFLFELPDPSRLWGTLDFDGETGGASGLLRPGAGAVLDRDPEAQGPFADPAKLNRGGLRAKTADEPSLVVDIPAAVAGSDGGFRLAFDLKLPVDGEGVLRAGEAQVLRFGPRGDEAARFMAVPARQWRHIVVDAWPDAKGPTLFRVRTVAHNRKNAEALPVSTFADDPPKTFAVEAEGRHEIGFYLTPGAVLDNVSLERHARLEEDTEGGPSALGLASTPGPSPFAGGWQRSSWKVTSAVAALPVSEGDLRRGFRLRLDAKYLGGEGAVLTVGPYRISVREQDGQAVWFLADGVPLASAPQGKWVRLWLWGLPVKAERQHVVARAWVEGTTISQETRQEREAPGPGDLILGTEGLQVTIDNLLFDGFEEADAPAKEPFYSNEGS